MRACYGGKADTEKGGLGETYELPLKGGWHEANHTEPFTERGEKLRRNRNCRDACLCREDRKAILMKGCP